MSDDLVIADLPIAMGALLTAAIRKRITAAINTRTDRNMNGSAYGKPYLAPTKPVLHNATKRIGANLDNFKPRKSPSGEQVI